MEDIPSFTVVIGEIIQAVQLNTRIEHHRDSPIINSQHLFHCCRALKYENIRLMLLSWWIHGYTFTINQCLPTLSYHTLFNPLLRLANEPYATRNACNLYANDRETEQTRYYDWIQCNIMGCSLIRIVVIVYEIFKLEKRIIKLSVRIEK